MMIMINSNFISSLTKFCIIVSFLSSSGYVCNIRYFVFNLIYFSIKSSSSIWVSNTRYFAFSFHYFTSKKRLPTNLEHSVFANILLYFDILVWSPTLNIEPSLLFFLFKSIYMFGFTSTGFVLIVLWYVLLYLLIISSNLSIYLFLMLKSCISKFCSLRF